MKIYKEEIIFYLLSIVSFILIMLFDVLSYRKPNLIVPNRRGIPSTDIDPSGIPEINPNPSSPAVNAFSWLRYVFIILLVIFLLLMINRIRIASGGFFGTQKVQSLDEQVQRVKDARKEAYRILEEGLKNKTYTKSYISAYLALDTALDYFREIRRPPHWTPKEYAYSVSQPVFRPAVFRFVCVFYDLRYGSENAQKQDLINFKQELDFLFNEDVPESYKTEWEKEFNSKTSEGSVYQIPRSGDLTKPGGN